MTCRGQQQARVGEPVRLLQGEDLPGKLGRVTRARQRAQDPALPESLGGPAVPPAGLGQGLDREYFGRAVAGGPSGGQRPGGRGPGHLLGRAGGQGPGLGRVQPGPDRAHGQPARLGRGRPDPAQGLARPVEGDQRPGRQDLQPGPGRRVVGAGQAQAGGLQRGLVVLGPEQQVSVMDRGLQPRVIR